MPSRPRRNDAVERILDASVELFLRNGVQGTNMDSIAAQARSSKQTMYTHFADKDAILDEALNRVVSELSDVPLDIDEQAPDFQAQLARLAFAYLTHVSSDRAVSILRLCVESTRRSDEAVQPRSIQAFRETQSRLARYMQHLITTGKIVSDDADAAAQDFLGLVVGDTERQRLLDNTFIPDENQLMQRAERAARLFCRAVRAA
jgi:AcrR family transcriptional regulator